MNKKVMVFILFFGLFLSVCAQDNPWGHLKKIYFYDSINKYDKVQENLALLNLGDMKRNDRKEISLKLITFGDYYFSKGKYDLAESFYKEVLKVSPDYWYVVNRLENIYRKKGKVLFNFKNVFKQFSMVLNDFEASFFIFNNFFNILFFSVIFLLFVFTLILFVKYFKLAGNDILIDDRNMLSLKKIILIVVVLLWPVFLFSGWVIYPFLIVGFLWTYMNINERKSFIFLLILVAVVTVLFAFNGVIEQNFKKKEFKIIREVFEGKLFDREIYSTFDNELKVYQALSYYESGDLQTSEDILNSTGENYNNKIKYNLLGNIYFKFENYTQCIKYFRMSLKLDEKSDITLNNFTMALLRNNNPEVFNSWAKRYPAIKEYKKKILILREIEINQNFFWKRLFNSTEEHFNLGHILKDLFINLLTLPIFYCILIFIMYLFLIKKLFSLIGQSTYCSKCSKIIKESSVHKSYKLCNECYQLFLIKDVIFLEAKILKEKELSKKYKKKYLIMMIFSLLIPGLKLSFAERGKLFIIFSGLFYFLLGFYVFNVLIFKQMFLTAPIFLNFIGFSAILLYFLLNIYSLWGESDGF